MGAGRHLIGRKGEVRPKGNIGGRVLKNPRKLKLRNPRLKKRLKLPIGRELGRGGF